MLNTFGELSSTNLQKAVNGLKPKEDKKVIELEETILTLRKDLQTRDTTIVRQSKKNRHLSALCGISIIANGALTWHILGPKQVSGNIPEHARGQPSSTQEPEVPTTHKK